MRAGVFVSAIGHVGAVIMTMLAWEAAPRVIASAGAVVPVEIVTISDESNVRALAEIVPEEDLAPEEQEETTEARTVPTVVPDQRRERPRETEDELDLDALARMFNADTRTGRRQNDGAAADRTQQGAGRGTAEQARLEDYLTARTRQHLMRCWRMPVDLPDPDRLVITVEFELDRNGHIRGQPRVTDPPNYRMNPAMGAAGEAALRAVRLCDPYPFPEDPILGENYDVWDQLEYTFRPRL